MTRTEFRNSPVWCCLLPAAFVLTALVLAAAPARAKLPPLIPREVLLGNPARMNPRISPDGTRLSYLAPSDRNVLNIWVETLGKGGTEMVTADTLRGIFGYNWAEDGRHLLYIQDQNGDENWHVHAADLQTREDRDLTPFPGAAADAMFTDPNHPEAILVGLNKRDPRYFDMYRIDLTTGAVKLEAENPGDVTEWAMDADFHIRGAVALDAQNNDTILRLRDAAGGPWRDLVRWPFMEAGSVLYKKILGFTPDGKGLYVQSPIRGDKSRLVVLDTGTGEEIQELAADPEAEIWNPNWEPVVMINPRTHRPEAVAFNYGKPRWKFLDPAVQKDFDRLEKAGGGVFNIASRDHDDKKWVVRYYADVMPDRYYLYDRVSGTTQLLFESLPEMAKYTLAPMEFRTFAARDGREIPCFLTLPVGVEPRNLPMVLYVHGGPWAQDDWIYEPWVQLFANRGYAVLQVNYRGSTGYGKAHLNAGNGQWGVGAMQNDLSDAVAWMEAQGIADPKRVAIVGGSYGGYATLSGLTFTPDLYACGVDLVGPSDVAALFQSFPPYWAVRKVRWVRRVGDVEHDDALNRRISPLYHADQIRVPLLIGHGSNDPRVKQAASDAIVAAVRKNGKKVQYLVYPDEGHGLGRPENNLDFVGRMEEFLAGNLGGRKEPWREVPGSSVQVK